MNRLREVNEDYRGYRPGIATDRLLDYLNFVGNRSRLMGSKTTGCSYLGSVCSFGCSSWTRSVTRKVVAAAMADCLEQVKHSSADVEPAKTC